MASMGSKILIVMVVVLSGVEVNRAFSVCNIDENGIEACRPYVSKQNPITENPSKECCGAISNADLQCLCGYKDSSFLPALGIDPALALALPQKCGLTPPSNC